MFVYTRTEDFIYKIMKSLYITNPYQLSIENISQTINLSINYWPYSSETAHKNGKYIIFLDERLTGQEQWQVFTHELAHVFWHVGRQEFLPHPFVQLQEKQANYFSYHFCVPTFMLQNLKGVDINVIMNLFNVEYDFAYTRLEMYQNKLLNRRINNHG